MALKQEAEALSKISLFAKLDESKLKLLAFTSEWTTFEPGAIVCQQGEPGNEAYIIIEGTAEIYLESPEGSVHVATRVKNDIIGETAIMCDVPRTATVKAGDKLSVLKISKDVFFQILMGSPEVAVEIIRELALRLESTTRQLAGAR
ncbi:MAG: cyclic nucleotide-binding domain-containing protein [Gammaproteobacteria bacterium]